MAWKCYPETAVLDNVAQVLKTYHIDSVLSGSYTGSVSDFKSAYRANDGVLFDLSSLFDPTATQYYHNSKIITLANGYHAILDVKHWPDTRYCEKYVELCKPDMTPITGGKYTHSAGDAEDYSIFYIVIDPDAHASEACWGILWHVVNASYVYGTTSVYSTGTLEAFEEFLQGAEMTEDPYQLSPESDSEGGYGDFDYSGDPIGLPSLPSLSIADSGMVTLYKPTLAQLQSLASYLWAGLFDPSTFKKIFADPMDCILSLAIAPVSPTATNQQELKVGNVGTGITIDVLDNQFVQVTYKTLNIGERTRTFMDDSPYTKAQIYLPYIGVRGLAIDDIIRADLDLQYNIDLFTGACNAALKCTKRNKDKNRSQLEAVLYQFTGNVLANIPVTGQNFAAYIQATIGAVGTAVGVATGAGAAAGLASAVNAATSMKPDVEKSGNLSSTAGFLGVQKPYLILTYPHVCIPAGREDVVGTPSFIGLASNRKLSSFSGFTKLHRVNVKGIYCTDAERNLILEHLTGEGVIL